MRRAALRRFVPALFVAAAALALGGPGSSANCTTNSAVIPIFQCGFVSWFAPPPPGSGTVTSSWWQLGYGNGRVTAPYGTVFSDTLQGTGIAPAGLFSGNDSGRFPVYLDQANAPWALGTHPQAHLIPSGALCSNYQNSWGAAGVDGCADNPRTTTATDNDNLLNTFIDQTYGQGYYTLDQQIDYPMALLLRESTGRFFALAFVSNRSRGSTQAERANDLSEGFFDFGEISDGESNPITGERDIVPWQPVPVPRIESVYCPPGSMMMDVRVSWPEVRIVSDRSVRPSSRTLANPGGGVGVLDQGALCRYQLQQAPVTDLYNDPNTLTWSDIGPELLCGSGSFGWIVQPIQIPGDTALRVRTILGKKPRTTSTTLADARVGALGDLGYEATRCDGVTGSSCVVSPPMTILAGKLVSEEAVDTVATRNRNAVLVTFRTTSELTVSAIEILGRLDHVLKAVAPKEGSTGAGATYEVLLTPAELRGSKELRVRLVGPGTVSGSFGID